MLAESAGFIGAGRVARIMLSGWAKAGCLPRRVLLFDTNPGSSEALKSLGPALETTTDAGHAATQQVVFLAVHPPVVKDALAAIRGKISPNSVLVSLAPKFTIDKLAEMLGGFNRIGRVIPNAPSVVGRGYNPVAFGEALNDVDKQMLRALFEPLGDSPEVEEGLLEAYAILTAMGPTYFWPQLYALGALGESFGMSRAVAMAALDKMLWGAMATIRESGLSGEQVQDLIPVKPMDEEIGLLSSAYEVKLKALMEKIRP